MEGYKKDGRLIIKSKGFDDIPEGKPLLIDIKVMSKQDVHSLSQHKLLFGMLNYAFHHLYEHQSLLETLESQKDEGLLGKRELQQLAWIKAHGEPVYGFNDFRKDAIIYAGHFNIITQNGRLVIQPVSLKMGKGGLKKGEFAVVITDVFNWIVNKMPKNQTVTSEELLELLTEFFIKYQGSSLNDLLAFKDDYRYNSL